MSLQYVNVSVDELIAGDAVRPIRSLEDSGTELCVINPNLLESVVLPKLGNVRLRGIVGDSVSADLVKLHISLVESNNGVSHSIPIVCAICPGLIQDLILTSVLVSQLQRLTATTTHTDDVEENCCDNIMSDSLGSVGEGVF